MSIDKSPIRVGGATSLDPISGLSMFRKYITFEANRENEVITVWYEEWLESPIGNRLEKKSKHYCVKNVPEIGHYTEEIGHFDVDGTTWIVDTPSEYVIDTPVNNGFNNWYNYPIVTQMAGMLLGRDLIVGSINASLTAIPHNAVDGYITT